MFKNLSSSDPRLQGLIIIQGVGLSSNIYVIYNDDITLIDSGVGNEYNKLDNIFNRLNLPIQNIRQVILTHAHPDHYGGLLTSSLSNPRIYVHKDDFDSIEGLDKSRITKLVDGSTLVAAGHNLKVIHTPGHTEGSICLYDQANKILFSGDTIFPDGFFGRTDLPGGDQSSLVESLHRLTKLEVESLLAGHERPIITDGDSHIKSSYQSAHALSEVY